MFRFHSLKEGFEWGQYHIEEGKTRSPHQQESDCFVFDGCFFFTPRGRDINHYKGGPIGLVKGVPHEKEQAAECAILFDGEGSREPTR